MIELYVKAIPWPFPKWVTAVTIWPFIFYERRDVTWAVKVHEHYHWKDQLRWGVIPWFVAYLALLLFYGGGRRHPLERQAYALQDDREETKADML